MLKSYFNDVIISLSTYPWVRSVEVLRFDMAETNKNHILIYRLRAFLLEDNLLEMMERVVQAKDTDILFATKYSFHWQTTDQHIIKRWDNAPHHPEVQTHPHHIHDGSEENVIPGQVKNALEILRIIDGLV